MTPEYLKTQAMIEEAIKNRTISLSGKKAQRYEQGDYRPFFSLADRGGELICIHCGNRKVCNALRPNEIPDKEIVRLSFTDVTEGLLKVDGGGKTKSWPEVTRAVMRYYRVKPEE